MNQDLKRIIRSKFATDSLFNFISVLFLGVCGLLLNFIIARKYDARTLGIFNEVYAFYIVFSQFAALGVQVSSLKHIAEHSDDQGLCREIFTAAFLVVLFSATFFSLLLFLLRHWIAIFFGSPAVATGILWIIPGLWCFALNKLLLNVLNGFRQMKAFALFTSFRYLAMVATLFVAVLVKLSGERLTVIFSVAEILLLVLLVLFSRHQFAVFSLTRLKPWVKKHLVFGLKSMIGGVTADMNTRIDVIILGYYSSERVVGIYSIASTIIEGIAKIPYILRQNIDPLLAKLMREGKVQDIRAMVRQWRPYVFWGMFCIGAGLIVFYGPVIDLVTRNRDFQESWPILAILIVGITVQSSYIPFSGILVQSGYPLLQTIHLILFTLTNIVLNLIFVPYWGMFGSAIATSCAFVLYIVYLKVFTYRALRIRI